MVAVDALEQLHAAALQPEHADAIADLGPFGIEIVGDERVGQRPHLKGRACRHGASRLGAARASATALVSIIALPEKKRRCSAASSRSRGLVEQPPVDADHAVAADHPVARPTLQRLGGGELAGDFAGIA